MNIQFDLMKRYTKCTKKEFIQYFIKKYPEVKARLLESELTAINKDYEIINYHNKGFIFNWGELIHDKFNWGAYVSSFNMNYPDEFFTVGGEYVYPTNSRYTGMESYDDDELFGIHPNIHIKHSSIKFESTGDDRDSYDLMICLSGEQSDAINNFTKHGYLHGALQVVRNMFNYVSRGDGLWYDFDINTCDCCDEFINGNERFCDKCR